MFAVSRSAVPRSAVPRSVVPTSAVTTSVVPTSAVTCLWYPGLRYPSLLYPGLWYPGLRYPRLWYPRLRTHVCRTQVCRPTSVAPTSAVPRSAYPCLQYPGLQYPRLRYSCPRCLWRLGSRKLGEKEWMEGPEVLLHPFSFYSWSDLVRPSSKAVYWPILIFICLWMILFCHDEFGFISMKTLCSYSMCHYWKNQKHENPKCIALVC